MLIVPWFWGEQEGNLREPTVCVRHNHIHQSI